MSNGRHNALDTKVRTSVNTAIDGAMSAAAAGFDVGCRVCNVVRGEVTAAVGDEVDLAVHDEVSRS